MSGLILGGNSFHQKRSPFEPSSGGHRSGGTFIQLSSENGIRNSFYLG